MKQVLFVILLLISLISFFVDAYSQDTIKILVPQHEDTLKYHGYVLKRAEDFSLMVHMPNDSIYGANRHKDTIIFRKYITSALAYNYTYVRSGFPNAWITFYKNRVLKEMGNFYISRKYVIKKIGTWLYFSHDGRFEKKEIYDNDGNLEKIEYTN